MASRMPSPPRSLDHLHFLWVPTSSVSSCPLPLAVVNTPPSRPTSTSTRGATVHPCVDRTALLALKIHEVDLDTLRGDPCAPGLSLSPPPRSVMAEPDYLEDPCDELIKPKKLLNPVKSSRNHQDLHRELLMNQKRGLAPQNKPELQKVLEKRKREQVLKAQREEQEAHKKRSDLEIELLKRQQKLEQLELEQQKNEEEQENTPEFVKMKSNLRRTRQEEGGEERTT